MKRKPLVSTLLLCAAITTAQAQQWTAPQVPGENLSTLSSTTTVYFYNVEADAFVINGMDWNTNACATRLTNGDTKISEPQRCYAIRSGSNVSVRLQSFPSNYVSCLSGNAYDIYVDQSTGYTFRFTETASGSRVYTLNNTAQNKQLDLAWSLGGHLTLVNGAGVTKWAFLAETTITNGSYARYKAQRALYNVYRAIIDAGKAEQYADAIAEAQTVYETSTATTTALQTAAQNLFTAAAADLEGPLDVSFLFRNTDMTGAATLSGWTTSSPSFAWGEYEVYHAALTLSQTRSVPQGLYDVCFRSLYREDATGSAPTLTAKGSNTVVADIPSVGSLNYLVGNSNSNNWTSGELYTQPNGMQSAGQALCHPDAQAVASNVIIDAGGSLQISVSMTSTQQWLNWQGVQVIYKGTGTASLRDDLNVTIAEARELLSEGGAGAAKLQQAIDAAVAVSDDSSASGQALINARTALMEAMEAYRLDSASLEHPLDWSDRLLNRSFEKGFEGWENVSMSTQSNTAFALKSGTMYAEKWVSVGNAVGDASLLQTVADLGLGIFVVRAVAHNIQENSNAVQRNAWIVANLSETEVHGDNTYTLVFTNIEKDAVIGFKAAGATGNWLAVDHFELLYAGQDFDACKTELQRYISQAESVLSLKMEAGIRAALEEAISKARAQLTATTADGYPAVSTPLRTLKQDAEVSAAAFEQLAQAIAQAEERYGTGSLTGADAYLAAIEQAKAVNDNLNSTQEQMAAEIENLEKAYRRYRLENASGVAPTVTTNPRYARGCVEAFGRMTVSGSASNILEQGFCYSETNPEPTVLDQCGTDYLDYNGRIYRMPMKPGTLYYIRAYAITKNYAVGYGDVIRMSTLPQGDVRYIYYDNGAPAEQNERITSALADACNWWTNYTSIRGFTVTCNYSPGTPTADCGYGGNMRMGTNMGQRAGTCLHEMNHGIGGGTLGIWGGWENSWLRTSINGDWAGERANAALRFWENRDDLVITGAYDDAHWGFRPFSGQYEEGGGGTAVWENKYAFNGAHLDAWAWAGPNNWNDLQAVFIANSCINQGMCEDGLVPVNYYSGGFCLPAYVFEHADGQKYYIKNEREDCGLYDSYLVEEANGKLVWKTIDLGDIEATENAAWYVSFTPGNQYYQLRNASTGHYISYSSTGSGSFRAVTRSSISANENFHVIRGRNDISIGSMKLRGYWFIHQENSNAPHTLAALTNGNVAAPTVNLYDSGADQRWLLLSADELQQFEQGVKKEFQNNLKDLIAQIRKLKRVSHTEDVADADATLESTLQNIETQSASALTASDVKPLAENARQAACLFLSSVTPADLTKPFDLTFMIDNAALDTEGGWSDNPTFNESCCEYYQRTFDFNQTLNHLPKGTFKLTVQAFQRPGAYDSAMSAYDSGTNNVNAVLYMGGTTQKLLHIAQGASATQLHDGDVQAGTQSLYIPDNMASAAAHFKRGLYLNELLTSTTASDTSMKIGLRGTVSSSRYWTCFDDFHLYFYGSASPDVVTAISDVDVLTQSEETVDKTAVYDLSGCKIADGGSLMLNGQLPAGIYIIGGKKVIVP